MKKIIVTSIVTGTVLFANVVDTVKEVATEKVKTEVTDVVVKGVNETSKAVKTEPIPPTEQEIAMEIENAPIPETSEIPIEAVPSVPEGEPDMPNIPEIDKPDIKIIDPMPDSVSELKDKAVDTAKKEVTEKVIDAVRK